MTSKESFSRNICVLMATLSESGFPGVSVVKYIYIYLPIVQETWVGSQGGEDPLEKGMAAHSSVLAWRIPRTQEPSRLQFMGSQRVGQD